MARERAVSNTPVGPAQCMALVSLLNSDGTNLFHTVTELNNKTIETASKI